MTSKHCEFFKSLFAESYALTPPGEFLLALNQFSYPLKKLLVVDSLLREDCLQKSRIDLLTN